MKNHNKYIFSITGLVFLLMLTFCMARVGATNEQYKECVSQDVGIAFVCEPSWGLSRQGRTLRVEISREPLVEMKVEEDDHSLHFMSEMTRDAFESMDRYEDGFDLKRVVHCDRETIQVNGLLKGDPTTWVSDYYLIDHGHLHSVKFTIKPKAFWDSYREKILKVIDSVRFVKHTSDLKFHLEPTSETCEELIPGD